jgi:hypothetical protein
MEEFLSILFSVADGTASSNRISRPSQCRDSVAIRADSG